MSDGSGDHVKPYDIRLRTLDFSDVILDVTGQVPGTPEGCVVRSQLADAATSIGANVEEGDGALTKPDRRKSYVIARKEACETIFWLRLVERKWGKFVQVKPHMDEVSEIICILSAIIAKLS